MELSECGIDRKISEYIRGCSFLKVVFRRVFKKYRNSKNENLMEGGALALRVTRAGIGNQVHSSPRVAVLNWNGFARAWFHADH